MRLRILEICTVRNWFIPQVGFLMRKLEICAKYTIAYIQFFAQCMTMVKRTIVRDQSTSTANVFRTCMMACSYREVAVSSREERRPCSLIGVSRSVTECFQSVTDYYFTTCTCNRTRDTKKHAVALPGMTLLLMKKRRLVQ